MSCDICHGMPNCPCCSDAKDFETCERCNGEGWIWEDINGEPWDGTGSTADCIRTPCPDCDGKGIIYLNN